MAPTDSELLAQVNRLGTELEKRAGLSRRLNRYFDADCPIPEAVVRARMTNAYKLLMPMSVAPWASLIVQAVEDRLQVSGIRSPDPDVDEVLRGLWQDNDLDAESKLAHNASLIDGRCFATVWPENGGDPQVTYDGADQMIVEYREGSRRHRVAALRYWLTGDVPNATLYRPDGLYKFVGPKNSSGFSGTRWERRLVPDEDWPLANPYDVVNVVELAVNRRIRPGTFGYARGEYQHVTGLLDRINLLTFLGLVVALWMGFPLRGVLGAKVLRDDEGKPLPPFDADADKVFQIVDKDAKLAEFKAADRSNLSIFEELSQLAYITSTPAHYFPLETGISNISAETVTALEGGLHSKVARHKASLGQGHKEIMRLLGAMAKSPVTMSPRAQILWKQSETRSLAEAADAAGKLKDILPWQALAEKVLDADQDEISRWESMRSSDALSALIAGAAATPTPAPEPVAA